MKLKCKTLCEILDSNELKVDSEEIVFDSVKRWLEKHSSERETSLRPLLKVVRLPLLTLKVLYQFSLNKIVYTVSFDYKLIFRF